MGKGEKPSPISRFTYLVGLEEAIYDQGPDAKDAFQELAGIARGGNDDARAMLARVESASRPGRTRGRSRPNL